MNMLPVRKPSRARQALLVAFAAMVLLALPAQAAPAERSTNVVFDATSGEPIADSTSTLVRTDNGISMTIRTTGLTPGDTYTIWWVVFNDPEACEHGFGDLACGPDDLMLFGGEAAGVVGYATGNIVGKSGRGNFGAHLKVGDSVGFLESEFIGVDHDGLTNPRGAEIHLVVRSHGTMIPGMIPEQIHTFDGGCEINDCVDQQVTFHIAD